jgi:adenylyl-sulfate kinase
MSYRFDRLDTRSTIVGSHPRLHSGLTAWLTGLSGSGKTTIGQAARDSLVQQRYKVELLDADVLRRTLNRDLGFSHDDRFENVRRIVRIAEMLNEHGFIAIVAAIAPYRIMREELRATIHTYREIYIDAPLSVCEGRDPKGLYARARAGQLKGFTGIDDPYEAPLCPDVRCDTSRETIFESSSRVIGFIIHQVCIADMPGPQSDR